MKKIIFYTELCYIVGLVVLAIGTACMERADFGMSMIVAPAYVLHLKISQYLPFFSFGMAEYTLQAIMLLVLSAVLKKIKFSYFFSFVTAVFYGFLLDLTLYIVGFIPEVNTVGSVIFFILGMLLACSGVALLFKTYISPEAYELFVKEISSKSGTEIHKVKTVYDCISCILSVLLSFAFFGLWHFEGIKLGTFICAVVNGTLIKTFTMIYDKYFTFNDRFGMRAFFEKN